MPPFKRSIAANSAPTGLPGRSICVQAKSGFVCVDIMKYVDPAKPVSSGLTNLTLRAAQRLQRALGDAIEAARNQKRGEQ